MELADTRKLAIVTLGAMKQYSRIEKFLSFLRSWYLCYFTPDAARQIQSAAPTPYLNKTGSNLNNVAQYMYRENPSEFKKTLASIQSKIPNIQKISPVKMQNGQMVLEFWQNGFDEPFFSSRMSDGTLKLFAYYMLLHEKNPRQLVFIEEPENGLYHQYMEDLALEMAKSVGTGYSKQLFVTTHSPFFVNALPPEQVWVLDKGENGFSTARCASEYEFVSDLINGKAAAADLLGVFLVNIRHDLLESGGIEPLCQNGSPPDDVLPGLHFLGVPVQHFRFDFIPECFGFGLGFFNERFQIL